MKQTKVPLRASHVPNPHVSLSGPRCQVQEAKQALMSALTSLTIETLGLDGAGAQRYFKTQGKVSKELVEDSCCVIIQEKQTVVTPNVSTKAYASKSLTITPQTLITGRSMRTLDTTTIPYVDVSSLVQQVRLFLFYSINSSITTHVIKRWCLLHAFVFAGLRCLLQKQLEHETGKPRYTNSY